MKLTKEFLIKTEACSKGISRFLNTPELQNIESDNKFKSITTNDLYLFKDIMWLIKHNKNVVKISQLTYNDLFGYSEKRIYDKNGNELTRNNSNGYSKEHTYDERGNTLTSKDSDGYSYKYTYDEKDRLLTYKDFDGNLHEYIYDEKGRILAYKGPDNYSEKFTYNKIDSQLTYENSDGCSVEYTPKNNETNKRRPLKYKFIYVPDVKYDLTLFQIKYF